MNKTDRNLSGEVLAELFPFSKPEVTKDWLKQEEEIKARPIEDQRIIARFSLPAGGEAQLLDLSPTQNDPNVVVVYKNPYISRGRSPAGTILSPLELFIAFNPSVSPPEILRHHHSKLARRGIFASQPRTLPAPLWGVPDSSLPPEYGPVRLCNATFGSFLSQWAWFSMGHGVRNSSAAVQMSTGWSVVTGTSAPRAVALCMTPSSNPASALARYEILNQQGNGAWINIYSSPDWTGRGEGVGYQTYGPDEGRTRIRLITQNNAQYVFWAGASWGSPQDWIGTGV